jgi:hypothetical protein
MIVSSYIDASYATHQDFKGQTGSFITVGGGAAYAKSSKQKLVTKSSTEAELVGASDGLTQVIWTRNFLESQGYKQGATTVYQDNKSTIFLEEKGKSKSQRTRHVSIRYFFIKDRVDLGEIKIQYLPTEDMVADYFTKPLQGELFLKFRNAIMNS